MKKTILITGAAGFIGTNLVRYLCLKKVNVIGIDNFDPFYSELIKKNNIRSNLLSSHFTFFEIDIRNRKKLREIIVNNNVIVVIHLAARPSVRSSIGNSKLYFDNNIKSTEILLQECFGIKSIKKIIFTSSSSVYGNNKSIPWKESISNLDPLNPYSISKLKCELLGEKFSKSSNKMFISLRLFSVYGNYLRPDLVIRQFTKNILERKPIEIFGDGESKRDYTHINDVLNAIKLVIEYEGSEFDVFNIGNQTTISLNQLINEIEEILKIQSIRRNLAKINQESEITFADISKSKSILGYNPKIHLKHGLAKYIEWFKKNC